MVWLMEMKMQGKEASGLVGLKLQRAMEMKMQGMEASGLVDGDEDAG